MSSNRGTSIRRSVQKEGLQLLLGEPCGGCLSPSPHPSDTRPLGWVGRVLTPTIHGFATGVDLLLAPVTPDQSLQHRA